jgi:hypothetical protein
VLAVQLVAIGSAARRRMEWTGEEQHERGGEMGRELSNEPMHQGIRTSWHGATTATDGDRRLHALRHERGQSVVTGSVAGGVSPSDWGARLKQFWAPDWWARPGYKYPF